MPDLPRIPIIDSHCHASLRWFEPVDTLLFQMDHNDVERAVLIGNLFEFDQSYQQEVFHAHSDRLASVVLIDPDQPDAVRQLEEFVADGASGVRLRAEERSPGDDPLAIWRAAERLGIPVSCFGLNAGFASDAFVELVEALPNLTIVLENLGFVGGADRSDEERTRVWEGLVSYPNLFIKVPALSSFCERDLPYKSWYPFKTPIPPHLSRVLELWGPERMMWGSDFPPVTGREGYASALRYPREELAHASLDAQREIFGGTAARVFFGS